ncbi:MAG: hypothetical protein ACXVCE_14905, partial [Bacteriovorax sp.]
NTSCLKQTESITPIAPVRTLAELQKESMMNAALLAAGNNELSEATKANVEQSQGEPGIFYLNMKYNINNLDVYETAHIPNSFEQIGNSFLKAMAKIFLKLTGGKTVNIGTVEVPVPDLNLDFDVIKSIKVKKIFLEYNKDLMAKADNKADFSFIKTLNIATVSGEKLFNYSKTANNCAQKCLDFNVVNGDIFDLIKDVPSVKVNPTLTITSLPKVTELKLDGEIDLQIGLKLPF